MNRIASLLPARNVLLDPPVPAGVRLSKRRVFEQAALLFENEHGIERGKVFDSLFARERLGSTGLGQAVAIPHGRIKGLKETIGALIRVTDPIPFEAPDGHPVRLFVFLLVPEHATEEHLEILSELAELLADSNVRASLLNAVDPGHIVQVLTNWEPYRPAA